MKKMLSKGFNASKCKTSLKMAVSRLKLLRNKKEIQLTQLKREVAKLLETGQDQSARIRVEHVVREEKIIAAYDLLDIYCELVVARLPIIETQKNCPIDLKEAIASIIFASPRCSDIPEFIDIRKHLTAKYGKEFATAAVELRPDSGVGRNLIEKLSANAPDGPTKVKILKGIAEENKIKWEPNWFKDNEPEPPAYVPPNEPNIDKIGKMHAEPQTFQPFQPAPSYEPMKEMPSKIRHTTGSGVDDSKFADSAAGPSNTRTALGAEPETAESGRYSGGVENSSFGARPKWNMEFKDASAAAHAAAESAEMASMAARAAVELASRGKFTDHPRADSKPVQNEGNRAHATNTDHGDYVDRFSADNSFRENPSRSEQVQRDPSRNVNASGRMDETNSNEEYHQTVKHDRPNSYQSPNPPMKAVQEKENQPYIGKRITSEVNPKMDHKRSMERYDKVQHDVESEEDYDDVESEEDHDFSPEDSELQRNASSNRVASPKYEHESFSYSDHRRDGGSVENPFHEDAVETRNQPGSYRSQVSGSSQDYGIMYNSAAPKFDDDDLDEDPFYSTGRDNFYKEDLETEEPYKDFSSHSNVSQDRKYDVFPFSEPRRFGAESHKHLFSERDDDSMQIEKESTNTPVNDAPPHFDDDDDDVDEFIQSPGRKSPVYSSPIEEILPRKWETQSSNRLYQSELTESFKKTDIFVQLDKPIRLGDDSDGENSVNDDEVKRPFARNILHSPKKHDSENGDPEEFVGSSYGRRTSSIISEVSTVEREDSLGKDIGASISKKSDYGDLPTTQQSSSGRTRSGTDGKSYDRDSIARLLEEAERLSSPRISSLQTTPDVIDDSQDNYQSNAESTTQLNVESLSGGLRNKPHRLPPPPFRRGTYSESSSISSVDEATNVREQSTLASSGIRESASKKESVNKKKPSILQGTYFDQNDGDDLTEDSDWKATISSRSPSDKKILASRGIRESASKEESVNKKKPSILQGTYFDPNDDDDLTEDSDWKSTINSRSPSDKKILDDRNKRLSSIVPQSYLESEDINNEEATQQTSARQFHSRRTRASGQSNAATGARTETRAPYSDASAKPQTKPTIQMESLEPRRREVNKTRPSRSKMPSREEIPVPPSVAGKQATSSNKDGKSGAETADSPKPSSSTEAAPPLRKISDKKPSHVHPNLPDSDSFAAFFESVRKDRQ